MPVNHLVNRIKEGRDAIWAVFEELSIRGCNRSTQKQQLHGRFSQNDYVIQEIPKLTKDMKSNNTAHTLGTKNMITQLPSSFTILTLKLTAFDSYASDDSACRKTNPRKYEYS